MGRPEHFRCENCIGYVDPNCEAFPHDPVWKAPDSWCMWFRAEWPVEEWLDWDIPEHRSIIEKMLTVVRRAEKST